MRKFVAILLVILLIPTISSSQVIWRETEKDSIVLITPAQLKETNLIFAEHCKLLEENTLLRKQIDNYKLKDSLNNVSDSLRLNQLQNYKELANNYTNQISILNSKIKKQNSTIIGWQIGGITVTVGLVIWLLLK